MKTVTDYILSIFLTIGVIFGLVPDIIGGRTSYTPEDESIILSCAVVSDTHCDSNSFRDRNSNLRKAFAGINRGSVKTDVLLNVGDITNSGVEREYINLRRFISVYAKPAEVVACIGNHDSWHESADPDYERAKKLFIRYVNGNGIETDKVYYSVKIKGCLFIALGTEGLDIDGTAPIYSDEQVSWFDRQLTEGEKTGMPVFVLCHRPAPGHNGYSGSGCIPQSIEDVLRKHSDADNPIIYFSGHCHTFSQNCMEKAGNIYYVSLPSTQYNDETENECNDNGGMGFVMEVYSDRVILKARNFIKDKYIDGYRFEITR